MSDSLAEALYDDICRRATVPDPASGMPSLTGWVIVGRKYQLPATVLAEYIANLPVVA